MSSVGATSSKRPGTAYAAAAAAKQRRQRIIAGVLGVVLIAVLVYEVPKLLKLLNGKSSSPPAAVAPAPVVLPPTSAKLLKALRRTPASDPFVQPLGTDGDAAPRAVPVPAGSVDPFAAHSASGSTTPPQTPAPPVTTSPLPETIVVGTSGGNRKPRHGWIVILASIPTAQGRGSATTFAGKARAKGITPVSVLNSSNRRPLRGGYWVVYTGPYATLTAVTNRAGGVHSAGYPTAYIRQLIVYR
jgi:hypothetical protein